MVEVTRGSRTTIVVRPNCSISWRGLVAFYAAVFLFSGSIACVFAWLGYWPVLPFAGLELLALGAGLAVTRRRCERCELIEVDNDTILVTREGGSQTLQTAWARVTHGLEGRVSLSVHGRQLEIGRFLSEQERAYLAARLRQVLAPKTAWASV